MTLLPLLATVAGVLSPEARLASHILLGHPELAGKGVHHNATKGSLEMNFEHKDNETGESTSLEYYVEYRTDGTPLLSLDMNAGSHHLGAHIAPKVVKVKCPETNTVIIHAGSRSDADAIATYLKPGALVSAARHWGCIVDGREASVQHRVISRRVANDTVVVLQTESAHLADYFRRAKIRFKTTRFPAATEKKHDHNHNQRERRQLQPYSPLLGWGFGSFLSSVWSGVKSVASHVTQAVKTVTKA